METALKICRTDHEHVENRKLPKAVKDWEQYPVDPKQPTKQAQL